MGKKRRFVPIFEFIPLPLFPRSCDAMGKQGDKRESAKAHYLDMEKSNGAVMTPSTQGNGHIFTLDASSVWNAPMDVYDTMLLPRWRAAIRRVLVKSLERESGMIAKMQNAIRAPWLDAYFVYTSSLGTHTSFLILLPALFFFGFDELGTGLLLVLGFGVYVSSFIKDLICSPRPFAPPVTRLTVGSHHLEYGFPSTHSTNSVSIALYFLAHVHHLIQVSDSSKRISETTYYVSVALLVWYTFSIVFGRLYTAMHSFTDCAMGVTLGAGVWALHWAVGEWVDHWVCTAGRAVPFTVVPLALVMVNQHPQPVDDCPCFEDAIAFISVVLGRILARWSTVHFGLDKVFVRPVMPGSTWETWEDIGLWWTIAACKMVFGILVIFVWRIMAKTTLHVILPPLFRLLAQGFTLPNRRFYTPATDYKNVPSEFSSGGGVLRPIPSVIHLPDDLEVEVDVGGSERSTGRRRAAATGVKLRSSGTGSKGLGGDSRRGELEKNKIVDNYTNGKDEDAVKHYDADVLTKVIVYSGIAALASEVLPTMFEILGWGVKAWA